VGGGWVGLASRQGELGVAPLDGVGSASRRPMQPRPNPRRRLILTDPEHAASRLDLGPHTPPRHEGACECRICEIERDRVVEHTPRS